jgi:osmotically-inducible protein OsmY
MGQRNAFEQNGRSSDRGYESRRDVEPRGRYTPVDRSAASDVDEWRGAGSGSQGRYREESWTRRHDEQEAPWESGREWAESSGDYGFRAEPEIREGRYDRADEEQRSAGGAQRDAWQRDRFRSGGGQAYGSMPSRGPARAYGQGGADAYPSYGGRASMRSDTSFGESGRYSGRGPKGYQRSDERLQEEIAEQLTRHPDIDASDVTIEVRGGEVTLSGTVSDRQMRYGIEHVVDQTHGVKEIHNNVRVSRPSTGDSTRSGEAGSRQGESATLDAPALKATQTNEK